MRCEKHEIDYRQFCPACHLKPLPTPVQELVEASKVGLMVLDLMWKEPDPDEDPAVLEKIKADADRLRDAIHNCDEGDDG